MKFLVLAVFAAVAVADVRHLNLQYGLPGSSYYAPQNVVTGSTQLFEVSPTTPSPLLRLPVHEAQDFNAQISNLGASGFSTPSPIISTGLRFTTPAPAIVSSTPAPNVEVSSFSPVSNIDLRGGFVQHQTPAPKVEISSFSPVSNIDLRGGFVQQQTPASSVNLGSVQFGTSTIAPSFYNPLPFNSFRTYNLGLNGYSTPAPILSVGSGQLTSIDSSLFSKDAALNSAQVSTAGGSINDAFGVSTPSSVSDEVHQEVHTVPQVAKHVYFFAAPEEHEPIRPRIRFISEPKKNIKYIFIKAPAPPQIAPVHITAPVQNEEKTVVYVLVKKPEDNQEIHVRQPVQTEAPKPEVYFIKYKNQKEAEEAINKVQEGKGFGGSQTLASDVGSNTFVDTLNQRINVKAEPIVSYIKSSSAVQEPLSVSGFNPTSYISSTVSPFINSGFSFTTPTPIVNYNLKGASFNSLPLLNTGLQYSTSAPVQFTPGLSFSTAVPDLKLDNGFSGIDLASRSQVVDTPDVNQNVIETSIESSTTAPLKVEVGSNLVPESFVSSTIAPETFVSSTISPQTIISRSGIPESVVASNDNIHSFGIYKSTFPPIGFKTYGLPNFKK